MVDFMLDQIKELGELQDGEGIAPTDGAGRSIEGECDLHRRMWIKSCQRLSRGT